VSDAKCAICGKPPIREYRPFCSKRCADIDLAHWLNGSYVIPGEDLAEAPAGENASGVPFGSGHDA
jgi:endogenous inhibitor of DNA gyrase (YacG/DUF329 family)